MADVVEELMADVVEELMDDVVEYFSPSRLTWVVRSTPSHAPASLWPGSLAETASRSAGRHVADTATSQVRR